MTGLGPSAVPPWHTGGMGLLDKLMFWKKDTVELDYDVEGCFTLPGAELDTAEPAEATAESADRSADDG